jgi:hypothetical protein
MWTVEAIENRSWVEIGIDVGIAVAIVIGLAVM